ncbi:uncharacterized protein PAC_06751 [Phialocephala subalpina]|uniref:2EXR domain-containing protein n=1 Tax=Phialocephala subalpina TaxID=576137 RepID=A0A1L7WVS2_9HELO|nr:uncharacterized protein PAC_06751 [Phialocephala subalpina]
MAKNPKTFEPFPRLPIELRQKIWKMSFRAGRVVGISTYRKQHMEYVVSKIEFKYPESVRKKISKLLPITLQVNHESRAETLRHYFILGTAAALETMVLPFAFDHSVDEVSFTLDSLEHYMVGVLNIGGKVWEGKSGFSNVDQLAEFGSKVRVVNIEHIYPDFWPRTTRAIQRQESRPNLAVSNPRPSRNLVAAVLFTI